MCVHMCMRVCLSVYAYAWVCVCVCMCEYVCVLGGGGGYHIDVTSLSMVLGLQSHSAIVSWPLTLQPVNTKYYGNTCMLGHSQTHTHTHTVGPGGQYCPLGGGGCFASMLEH